MFGTPGTVLSGAPQGGPGATTLQAGPPIPQGIPLIPQGDFPMSQGGYPMPQGSPPMPQPGPLMPQGGPPMPQPGSLMPQGGSLMPQGGPPMPQGDPPMPQGGPEPQAAPKRASSAASAAALAKFNVDPDARYTGTVAFFSKLKGYGFIEVTPKDVIPEDRVFVQWRNIESKDRFPFLVQGLAVEFGVMKWRDHAQWGKVSLRAKSVSLPGGGSILLQDELDLAKKTFIGGQDLRYTGKLKFYNPKSGYGYITVDPGYPEVEGTAIPTELRVERSEINAAGKQPQYMQNLAVEFGIWTTSRGVPKAYNVTLPGGIPLTQAALENRQAVGGQTYRGEVHMWNWKQGWGFIKADASVALPPNVQAKLTQQTQAAAAKALAKGKEGSDEELLYVRRGDLAPGVQLQKGAQVMFQIYLDDKGVGSCDVRTI